MSNSTNRGLTTALENVSNGLGISESCLRLRHYATIERARIKALAGWFLRIGDFETKYALAYHLYDASEHVTWIRTRLQEMRAGKPDASVRPELQEFLPEIINAPDDASFLQGFYGSLGGALLTSIQEDIKELDRSANANEYRLLRRIQANWQEQQTWFKETHPEATSCPWATYLDFLLKSVGGIHGTDSREAEPAVFCGERFSRPKTILFDDVISVGPLCSYGDRQKMSPEDAAREQFKVFFNEFYAAALLASILYDAADGDYPWELFADFSRHFWDEARHSEFGTIRLRELGIEPDRVNPILFDESQDLPVLHRIAYLTRGLEAYFMPRKPKRMKEYEESGDLRSQLFADQDWSDEINHVRYGSKWTDYLLEDDYREVEDIIEEVKIHLSRVRGEPVKDINAPF